MNDEQIAARGHRASKELELCEASFGRLRDAALAKIIASPVGNAAERETLCITLQVIEAVRNDLMQMVQGGHVAEHLIEAQKGA
jgi:hypothetical protein